MTRIEKGSKVYIVGDLKRTNMTCGIVSRMRTMSNNGVAYKVEYVNSTYSYVVLEGYSFDISDVVLVTDSPYKNIDLKEQLFNIENLVEG